MSKAFVFCNGCFDTLHAGHFAFLLECSTIAEQKHATLIIAIDSDEKIKKDI